MTNGDVTAIKDVQAYEDERNVEISQVGISGLRLPIEFSNGGQSQHSVMEAAFTVTLQQERKGTHMSRFIEVWDSLEKPFSLTSVTTLLNRLEEKLDAEKAQVELKFPLFFTRTAPVSKAESLMDFNCEIVAASNQSDPAKSHYELRLMAPVTSLCPCSKEISEFSAHSQRSHLTIALQFRDRQGFEAVDIDQLLMEMESVGSSRLYPLLKRPDEKYVTEMAYKTPRFVEDLVRDLVVLLRERQDLTAFSVQSENFESIHNHQAYAKVNYTF
ncbi:GTP cyclohydrolase FolE2 [Ignatzschineria cameli]|uniref:GTP cyclohydrolase FolE2 n=1 Tax=Ignatzschineria cameli TaxID=2182793 RepID=A0A2U2ASN8_9GAMM|nr:GTP cyclohydrolase FolE2 [Ignatzschineria cameli]PWD86469.1 GTP cyclohydrolase I FolE2 [Ignatzschineria cameli]PWD87177.1 GTP cyclohydrolase I FolE2 [Ignatzschineria cameli]PWD92150.1 GTP cyclohydrolase I FolE2 [Ignatzschineria cameli]PWD93265.1 GTP cyclohydrolase I FolE2 [Ignatzschineria cameli]PWD94007.1 GTP cyclohydrolase I FolE2 [Ignatzschineria cameli]